MQNSELCKDICDKHTSIPPANTQRFGAKSTKVHAIKTLEVIRTRKGLGDVMQASTPSILIPKTKEQNRPANKQILLIQGGP